MSRKKQEAKKRQGARCKVQDRKTVFRSAGQVVVSRWSLVFSEGKE